MDRRKSVSAAPAITRPELFTFRLLTERGPIAYDYSFQVLTAA
jgi:hypothetical protein